MITVCFPWTVLQTLKSLPHSVLGICATVECVLMGYSSSLFLLAQAETLQNLHKKKKGGGGGKDLTNHEKRNGCKKQRSSTLTHFLSSLGLGPDPTEVNRKFAIAFNESTIRPFLPWQPLPHLTVHSSKALVTMITAICVFDDHKLRQVWILSIAAWNRAKLHFHPFSGPCHYNTLIRLYLLVIPKWNSIISTKSQKQQSVVPSQEIR